ncbi:MAG TPA: prepilin peptidase [Thermoguttaceae bacterium]|nr:prepilin peptidase [Thermoguttaceae bacterium]
MLLAALLTDAAKWILVVWLFALGGAVGSFLNVVIYRLPSGMSLLRPPSHCPACKKPIRWFDNVPIFAWICLRGRCRDCGVKISPRYPIIEAVTAALFVVLAVVELASEGGNLPSRAGELAHGGGRPLEQLGSIYGYHVLLLCTLLAAVMIEYDGHRVPTGLFVPAWIGGLAAPLFWPALHPVATCPALEGPLAGATDGLAGLLAGLLIGWLVAGLFGARRRRAMILAAASVGLFLGWKAVVVLTLISAALRQSSRLAPRDQSSRLAPRDEAPSRRNEASSRGAGWLQTPPTFWLALTTLGWILAWSWLVESLPILG